MRKITNNGSDLGGRGAELGVLDYSHEAFFGQDGLVAGVDEVGRGCLAGPVVAAAVILDPCNIPAGLRDSKKLTRLKREKLAEDIQKKAFAYGVGAASVPEIEALNILQASLLAMRRSILKLSRHTLSVILVDGVSDPGFANTTHLIVKGDNKVLSIAAASILAKVIRDKGMKKLGDRYPGFDWHRNAGYGVPFHLHQLGVVGATIHHRKNFAPIRNIIDRI